MGKTTYKLTKYDKVQTRDITIIKHPNTGGYLLQNWVKQCNDKDNSGKIQNLIKSTKTTSPTGSFGAKYLRLIGDSFMYIETSSNNHGKINYLLVSKELCYPSYYYNFLF